MDTLDISTFKDDKKVVDQIADQRIVISLITCKFSELRQYYQAKALKKETLGSKPLYGRVLFFDNFDSLITGTPSHVYPKSKGDKCSYCG